MQVVEGNGGSEHLPGTVVAADRSPTARLVVTTVDEIIDVGEQSIACVATGVDGFYEDGIAGCQTVTVEVPDWTVWVKSCGERNNIVIYDETLIILSE